jgi:predicted nucleotidyltransferase
MQTLTDVPREGTIVPDMGTRNQVDSIASLIFPRTRLNILTLIYLHSKAEFYLREIIRLVNAGRGAVERELANLVEAGIITREKRGNHVYFSANRLCPIYGELKSMIVKTAGIADVLKSALKPLGGGIELAFIYGSYAKGTDRSSSDVDLMVVGDVSHRDVVKAMSGAQEKIGREINPTVFSINEFRGRIRKKDTFLRRVMSSQRIMLIGEEDEP